MILLATRVSFLFILIFPVSGLAQGLVQIENYSPDEYGGSRQNWSAIESANGTLFFGNTAGLLHFDGVKWNLKHVPSGGLVRSFAKTGKGIYWGGNGNFGPVEADSLNRFLPVSYLGKVDGSFHNFSSVWQFVEQDDKLLARTYEGLYIFEEDTVTVHSTPASLRSVFPFRNRLFTQIMDQGLSLYNAGEFTKIADTGIYSTDVIYDTLPLDENILLLSRDNGLIIYDGETFEPFEHEASDYINNNRVYRAVSLGQHRAAVATLDGGIVILDLLGNKYTTITEDQGLPTNMIYDVYMDREENLWAATDNSIAKLLVNNPVTTWGEPTGYTGATLFIGMVGNKTYVGSTEGLFTKAFGEELKSSDLLTARVYDGTETRNGYIISTEDGLYIIDNEYVSKRSDNAYFLLTGNETTEDLFYGVSRKEIDRIRLSNGGIQTEPIITMDVDVSDLYVAE